MLYNKGQHSMSKLGRPMENCLRGLQLPAVLGIWLPVLPAAAAAGLADSRALALPHNPTILT
jgi:hypothetical protein